jgi:hypothetical protein
MEALIRLLDDAEDIIITTVLRLRRAVAWNPRERRRVARLRENPPNPSTNSAQ